MNLFFDDGIRIRTTDGTIRFGELPVFRITQEVHLTKSVNCVLGPKQQNMMRSTIWSRWPRCKYGAAMCHILPITPIRANRKKIADAYGMRRTNFMISLRHFLFCSFYVARAICRGLRAHIIREE